MAGIDKSLDIILEVFACAVIETEDRDHWRRDFTKFAVTDKEEDGAGNYLRTHTPTGCTRSMLGLALVRPPLASENGVEAVFADRHQREVFSSAKSAPTLRSVGADVVAVSGP